MNNLRKLLIGILIAIAAHLAYSAVATATFDELADATCKPPANKKQPQQGN